MKNWTSNNENPKRYVYKQNSEKKIKYARRGVRIYCSARKRFKIRWQKQSLILNYNLMFSVIPMPAARQTTAISSDIYHSILFVTSYIRYLLYKPWNFSHPGLIKNIKMEK